MVIVLEEEIMMKMNEICTCGHGIDVHYGCGGENGCSECDCSRHHNSGKVDNAKAHLNALVKRKLRWIA